MSGSIVSDSTAVWYHTDCDQWWPSMVEELHPMSLDPVDFPKEEDQSELFLADVRGESIFKLTLLGKTTDHVLLLCQQSMESRTQPLLANYRKFRVEDADQARVFGAAGADEYNRAFQELIIWVKQSKSRLLEKRAQSAAENSRLPRVSINPETAIKTVPSAAATNSSTSRNPSPPAKEEFEDGYDKEETDQSCESGDGGEEPDIKSSDSWETVWDKLDWVGWEIVNGIYVKPGKKYFPGNTQLRDGIDYFTTLEGVQEYVRCEFGWSGPRLGRQTQAVACHYVPVERKLFSTPPDQPTIPQDPGKPLMSSVEKSLEKSSSKSSSKQGRKKTTTIQRTSAKNKNQFTMHKVHQTIKMRTKAKKEVATRKSRTLQTRWWQTTPVPSAEKAWKILQKLGYKTASSGCIDLPEMTYSNKNDAPRLRSLTGLRKFLCRFGIANYNKSLISESQATELERWVSFANVPVNHRNSIRKLRKLKVPEKEYNLALLLTANGFSTMNGKFWAPNVHHGSSEDEFVFDIGTEQDKLRGYIRSGWTLDATAHSMKHDPASLIGSPPPSKFSYRVSDEKHLLLRFWAAASAELPLPKFDPSKTPRAAKQVQLLEMLTDDYDEITDSDQSDSSISALPVEGDSPVSHRSRKKVGSTDGARKKKRAQHHNGPWWHENPVPSSSQAWKILQRLGYQRNSDKIYTLPIPVQSVYSHKGDDTPPSFKSLNGLRKFLCKFGIPDNDLDQISENDETTLKRWVQFANVPVMSRRSISILKKVSKPKTHTELRSLLTKNGFSTVDGKFWAPGYKHSRKCKDLIFEESDLSEGKDGRSKLKSFIRGAWTLDSNVYFLTDLPRCLPESKYGLADDESHLQLRLWAAATSEPLPPFKHPKRTTEIELLEMLPDEELTEELDLSDDSFSLVPGNQTQPSHSEENESTIGAGCQDNDSSASAARVETERTSLRRGVKNGNETNQKAKRPKSLPWYYNEDLSFLLDDWCLVEMSGWKSSGAKYFHPLLPTKRFEGLTDVRQYMCQYGIPDARKTRERIGKESFDRLTKWIRFVNVPIAPNYFQQKIQSLNPLSDKDAINVLVRSFGFKENGEIIFLPGADSSNEHVPGVHFVRKQDLASWLRCRTSWSATDSSSRRGRRKMDNETEEMQLRLRLWAAAKDDPLPSSCSQDMAVAETTEDHEFDNGVATDYEKGDSEAVESKVLGLYYPENCASEDMESVGHAMDTLTSKEMKASAVQRSYHNEQGDSHAQLWTQPEMDEEDAKESVGEDGSIARQWDGKGQDDDASILSTFDQHMGNDGISNLLTQG